MGKVLIIKGADFSRVAVSTDPTPEVWTRLEIEQGSINIVPTDANYGQNEPAKVSTYNRRLRSIGNIYLQSGQTLTIKGLKGLSGSSDAIRLDWCCWNNNARVKTDVVTTGSNGIVNNYFYINRETLSDQASFTNNTGQAAYFGLTMCGPNKDTDLIPVDSYNPLYYKIS